MNSPMKVSGHQLAQMWSEAPALMPHSSGCSCAGHVALHLDPGSVEGDIIDYLASRYAGGGETELAAFIEARRAQRGTTFATWLIGLDSVPLPAAARTRLLADLDATISSLARGRG